MKISKKAGICNDTGNIPEENAIAAGIPIIPAVIIRSHRTPYRSPTYPHIVFEITPLNAEQTIKKPIVASESPSSFSAYGM